MSALPSKPSRHFTSTQVGKISEQIVASQLMLVSRGRLSPYWPLADDDGVDFLLKDKQSGRIHEFQIKTWFASEEDAPKTVQFDTGARTFNEMSGGFLLAAMIDPANGIFWRGWLIPASRLKEVASVRRARRDKLVITPNPSKQSRDRYAEWQVSTVDEVVEYVFAGSDVGQQAGR